MSDIEFKELRRHGLFRPLVRSQVLSDVVSGEHVSDEMVQQARNQYLKMKKLDEGESFINHLRLHGMNQQEFELILTLPTKMKSYCEKHFRHKAESHFLSRKSELDQITYSLLRINNRNIALELYLRIEAGEDNFANLSSKYSEGSEKNTSGVVGPVPMNQSHPLLAERLRAAKPGVLLEPFQILEWWVIARLEQYQPAVFDESTAVQMSLELFNQWIEEETDIKILELPLTVSDSV